MPLKSKKHPKAAWKLSPCEKSSSPQSLSSSTLLIESEADEDDIQRFLEEASISHPSLIGKSAFIGRVADVAVQSRSCKIWLSGSSMVASSLFPGSTVSVSLAAIRFSSSLPLCSLVDEYAKHFRIGCSNRATNDAGNYFALATVFPSCKVLKDGVRLSSHLSSTLGFPASELVSSIGGSAVDGSVFSGIKISGEGSHSYFGNGNISPSSTPLYSQSRLGISATSQFSSPRHEEAISANGMSANSSSEELAVRFDGDLYSHALNMRTGVPCIEFKCKDIKADGADDILKLGGLSKECAILRDIIESSGLSC